MLTTREQLCWLLVLHRMLVVDRLHLAGKMALLMLHVCAQSPRCGQLLNGIALEARLQGTSASAQVCGHVLAKALGAGTAAVQARIPASAIRSTHPHL